MTYRILLLPGDGIGPEVVNSAQQVLQKVSQKFDFKIEFETGLIGHTAIEATNQPLPNKTLAQAKKSDAILLGAVGHPKYDKIPSKIRPEQGLLAIRKELNLFANLRPIKIFPALIDASSLKPEIIQGTNLIFYRELTSGIYFGEKKCQNGTATDLAKYSEFEIARIARLAFQAASKRKRKLTLVHKANVMQTSKLWQEVVIKIASEYPEVEYLEQLVDSMAMKLLTSPTEFDVILTSNLFGDILSDEASQISGSIGVLPSASLTDDKFESKSAQTFGLFEPIHGSAPDIAGQNIANPIATILSAAMLLDYGLGLKTEAKSIEKSVEKVLEQGFICADLANNFNFKPPSNLTSKISPTQLPSYSKDQAKQTQSIVKFKQKNIQVLGTVEMTEKILEEI